MESLNVSIVEKHLQNNQMQVDTLKSNEARRLRLFVVFVTKNLCTKYLRETNENIFNQKKEIHNRALKSEKKIYLLKLLMKMIICFHLSVQT